MTSPSESVLEVPIEAVIPSSANPRLQLRGLDELAASIKEHGVLEPLLVTANGGKSFHLVAGHRRLAGAKQAGLKTVPCIVRKLEESQQLAIQLVENLQREDLTPLEEAQGYGRLAAEPYRMATRAIAQLVAKSQPHVMHRLALLKLSPKTLEGFESGRLKLTVEDVGLLAQKPHDVQDRLFKETAYGSVKERLREQAWRDRIRREQEEAAKRPQPAVDATVSREQLAQRRKDKLRREAREARIGLLPRLIARGERELQYAAAMIAHDAGSQQSKLAGELLELKPVMRKGYGGSYPDWHETIARHAERSKKNAVDVLVALAAAYGEESAGGTYAGGSPTNRRHIERLQKLGYKPNARDRGLLKVRAR